MPHDFLDHFKIQAILSSESCKTVPEKMRMDIVSGLDSASLYLPSFLEGIGASLTIRYRIPHQTMDCYIGCMYRTLFMFNYNPPIWRKIYIVG